MSNAKWSTPQLIVLARGTPQESVLTHCKTQNPSVMVQGPLMQSAQSWCDTDNVGNCSNCQSRAFSDS
jgi:hypothetical protein